MKTKLTHGISVETIERGMTIYEKTYPKERRVFLTQHDIVALAAFLNLYLETHKAL